LVLGGGGCGLVCFVDGIDALRSDAENDGELLPELLDGFGIGAIVDVLRNGGNGGNLRLLGGASCTTFH